MSPRFRNRIEAGQLLAQLLSGYANRADVIVIGLARGGMPVAHEVSKALGVPLDVCIVRKIGVPFQPELAMGAIASGGARVVNYDVKTLCDVSDEQFEAVVAHEEAELQRREHAYRGTRPPLNTHGQWVILVDDGIATGASMRVAARALLHTGPSGIVIAVPVATPSICASLRAAPGVMDCVSLVAPETLDGVGEYYDDFSPTSDAEVRACLADRGFTDADRHPRG